MTAQPMNLLRTLGQMISRSNLAGVMGQRFSGLRDYYATFGYLTTITYRDMLAKYLRQGVAARIVDAPAQAIWDNPPQVISNDDEWNAAWQRLVTKHHLWQALLKADKLAGLGRYSCVFIGFRGAGSPETAVKAPNTGNLREVLYFQVYSQQSANIDKIDGDTSSENYMMPEIYSLQPIQSDLEGVPVALPKGGLNAIKAHRSRVLHIAENTLENEIYGTPRLERVFNDLDDMLKVSGGTAEAYWLTVNRGIQVDVDKEMDLTPEDAADLSTEIEEFQHQLRRFIRTRGVSIKNIGADIPRPKETFEMLVSLISGATGIPRRNLIGAEAGQLASEQDRANWAERITARRTEFAEPTVLFPLISMLTNAGALPRKEGLQITFNWPDAFHLNPLEKAQKAAQHARSATNFAKALETMSKLNNGQPGVEPQLDKEGNPIPGTGKEAVPGADLGDLVTVDEARQMMELANPKPVIDDPGDLAD